MIRLPGAFTEKMQALLGEEYGQYIACFEEPRRYGLRVNTKKISPEAFRKIAPWELQPIPWVENGFFYDGEQVKPAKHPYYFAGLYYLQEPSAMTPASRLPIQPGERVLDMCAAPGGKATELGAKLGGKGVLVANDISHSRAKGLLKNLELSGLGNLLVTSEEPGKLVSYFPAYFDKILIDAPCSGEGMFRKDGKMIQAWCEHGPAFFAKLQRNLLTRGAEMLRPGGLLLYSTCTFDPMENEGAIAYLLAQFPEFEICDMESYEGFCDGFPGVVADSAHDYRKTKRIFPHRMEGEGHFLALLQKRGEPHAQVAPGKPERQTLPAELEEFLGDISLPFARERFQIRGEQVYYMPEDLPALRGIRFLRSGLFVGNLKKKRFEPSQALAMFLTSQQYAHCLDFSLEDERVLRYLKGETLDVSDRTKETEKGWYLVCVDGYPLGFGKLAGQVLKNKYLPGWRWN